MMADKNKRTIIPCITAALIVVVFAVCPAFTEQQSPDPYIATFDGGGITLSEFKNIVQKITQKQAFSPTPIARKALLEQLIEKHLAYRDALSHSFDKDAEIVKKIQDAVFDIVSTNFLKKQVVFEGVTEEQAREYYTNNKEKYTTPEMRSAEVILINNKDKSGNTVADKNKEIAEELRLHMRDVRAKGLKQGVNDIARTFSDRYPALIFSGQTIINHWKGKPAAVVKAITDELFKMNKNEASVVSTDEYTAVILLSGVMPPAPTDFSLVKNKIIVELESERAKKAVSAYIDRISKEYHLSINQDVFDKAISGRY
jgi:PPIC-type PPIASE domain